MKTSSFLTTLRTHGALPLVFRAGYETVAPGYHLTEVKRVAYETMDCGSATHRWSETQFEVWVPPPNGVSPDREHLAADKFLRIIDRVETELPLNAEATARIHASFNGQPAALFDIETATARGGKLWVELAPDRTRCKAAERRIGSASGCCGNPSSPEVGTNPSKACGCGSPPAEIAPNACCA